MASSLQANTKLLAAHGRNYTVGCGLCVMGPPTSGVSSDWVADKLKVDFYIHFYFSS